jgi:sugar phosphate isomerase/epimerase
MTTSRVLSLAAGVCPETGPADFVAACASAGWPACGIWFDTDTWTDAVASEVRRRLDDTGLVALDMEPVFVTPDGDHGDRMIDAAAAVGARNLLVVSRGVDDDRFANRFAELCDRAEPHGIGCSIEFLAFMSVSSLRQSIEILDRVDRPNGGVLIDGLHLARTGGTPADVAAVAPARLAYAQLCDAPAEAPRGRLRRCARRPLDPRRPWAADQRSGRRAPAAHRTLDGDPIRGVAHVVPRTGGSCTTRTRHDERVVRRPVQRRTLQRIGSVVSPRRMNG